MEPLRPCFRSQVPVPLLSNDGGLGSWAGAAGYGPQRIDHFLVFVAGDPVDPGSGGGQPADPGGIGIGKAVASAQRSRVAVEAVKPNPEPPAMCQGHQPTQAIHLCPGPFTCRGRPSSLDRPPVKGQKTKISGGILRNVCRNVGLIPAGDDAVAKRAIGPPGWNQGIISIFRSLAAAEADGQPPGR